MTIPVPAATDPAADAALHIRNFAEAVDGKLASTYIVRAFDTGEQAANGDGSITAGGIPGMASIAGAVGNAVFLAPRAGTDGIYAPLPVRDPGTGNVIWYRCFNAPTNTVNVGKFQRIRGLCWGPPSGSTAEAAPPPWADDFPPDPDVAARQQAQAAEYDADRQAAAPWVPAPQPDPPTVLALPPGSTFPPGRTVRGLRYPGTDDPQWRTAAAIRNLADDIGAALGGSPLGLHLAGWRGVATLVGVAGGIGRIIQSFAGQLSFVRGAVATTWDASGDYRQSRNFVHIDNGSYTWAPAGSDAVFYVHRNTAQSGGTNPDPLKTGEAVGVSILAWGDAP